MTTPGTLFNIAEVVERCEFDDTTTATTVYFEELTISSIASLEHHHRYSLFLVVRQ